MSCLWKILGLPAAAWTEKCFTYMNALRQLAEEIQAALLLQLFFVVCCHEARN